MANLSEVFIAALRLAAALFGTNKDSADSGSQAPEPSQAAAQEASRPSTSGRVALLVPPSLALLAPPKLPLPLRSPLAATYTSAAIRYGM